VGLFWRLYFYGTRAFPILNFPCYDLYLSKAVENVHEILSGGYFDNVINCAKFYLNRVRGFDSMGVQFLALQ